MSHGAVGAYAHESHLSGYERQDATPYVGRWSIETTRKVMKESELERFWSGGLIMQKTKKLQAKLNSFSWSEHILKNVCAMHANQDSEWLWEFSNHKTIVIYGK